MKLSLIAAVAFALVVCQTEARGKGPWAEIAQTSRPPNRPLPNSIPRNEGHKSPRRKPATDNNRVLSRLRMEIGKTIVEKVKLLVQAVVAVFEMVKKLVDRIGWTILSRLMDTLIDALNHFSDSIGTSEDSSVPEKKPPPPALPEKPAGEETGSLPPADAPESEPAPVPAPESEPLPARSPVPKPYSTKCRPGDPRPRCQRSA